MNWLRILSSSQTPAFRIGESVAGYSCWPDFLAKLPAKFLRREIECIEVSIHLRDFAWPSFRRRSIDIEAPFGAMQAFD